MTRDEYLQDFYDRYRLTFNATSERPEVQYMKPRDVKRSIGVACNRARGGFITTNRDLKDAKKHTRTPEFLATCRGMQSGELVRAAFHHARAFYGERCELFVKGEGA